MQGIKDSNNVIWSSVYGLTPELLRDLSIPLSSCNRKTNSSFTFKEFNLSKLYVKSVLKIKPWGLLYSAV